MTQLNPYLAFDGNCREAMTFYQQCLGGELSIQSVAESAVSKDFAAGDQNKIMHAYLNSNGVVLMGSDVLEMGGSAPDKLVQGNVITLCLNCSSEDEIKTLFSKLSSGGKVTHQLENTFWGAVFGQLTDRFGIDWMLNYEKNVNA
jgi:PhnB protein